MRNIIFILLLTLLGSYSHAQDLIITLNGDSIQCKITSLEEEKLYFKILTDDYKHSYSISKLDKVILQNGETISFENDDYVSVFNPEPAAAEKKEKIISIPDELITLAKQGNRVFIECSDNGAAIHLKDNLEYFEYWDITPSLKMADFKIKLNIRYGGHFTYYTYAQFINIKTKNVVYRTKEVGSDKNPKNLDFNQKRSAVRVLFEQEIKTLFE